MQVSLEVTCKLLVVVNSITSFKVSYRPGDRGLDRAFILKKYPLMWVGIRYYKIELILHILFDFALQVYVRIL
jgi:hypothetical protein